MTLWVDIKYAEIIGARSFEGFRVQKRNPFQANFRCPHCGDSQTNKRKKRGFILEASDHAHLMMMCHNCGYSGSFGPSLRKLDPLLHREYVLERLKEQGIVPGARETIRHELNAPNFKPDITKFGKTRTAAFFTSKPGALKVSSLPADHPVKQYVNQRQIPASEHHRLYVVPNFKKWVNSFVEEGKFESEKDGPRLVLALSDQESRVFGITGRALLKNQEPRYLTVMMNKNATKVFGLDRISLEHDIFVVEGPIDSLFLPNALAMAGTDVDLRDMIPAQQLIMAYDNEPRNPEVVAKMEKAVGRGMRVVVWPESVHGLKDVNDMVQKGGLDPLEVHAIMRGHTYKSLSARLAIAKWRRC